MIYVTDTRPLILAAANRPDRLGQVARKIFQAVDEGKAQLVVPVTVLDEILRLAEKKVLRLRTSFYGWVEEMAQAPNFQLQPYTPDILLEAEGLTAVQDPNDRIIVATARRLGCPLITAEKSLKEGEWVETLWD